MELESRAFAGVVCSVAFAIWKARDNIFKQRAEISRLQGEHQQLVQEIQRLECEHSQAIAALTASHAQAVSQLKKELEQIYVHSKADKEERDKLHAIEIRKLRCAHMEAMKEQAKAFAEGRVRILPEEMREDSDH